MVRWLSTVTDVCCMNTKVLDGEMIEGDEYGNRHA